MNLRSLINFNDLLNAAIGINIHTSEVSGVSFSYCIIKNENDLLTLVESGDSIDSIEKLHEKLEPYSKPGIRVHVNYSGKGVLIKALDIPTVVNDNSIVQKLFPFIRSEDLVSQWYIGNATGFLAVTRGDLFSTMDTLSNLGYVLYSFSIGPFILDNILTLLKETQLIVQGYKIEFGTNGISEISGVENLQAGSKKIYQVGDQEVASEVLLAYSSACNIFFPALSLNTSTLPWTERGSESFRYRSQLYKVSKITLIATLLILVVNAGIFFWLQSETDRLESQVLFAHGKSKEEEVVQAKLVELTHSYEGLGWKSNMLPLYYSDQIAQTLPKGIQLIVLEVGALDEERVRQERAISFRPSVIKIKGLSENPMLLNQWVKIVEGLDWVSDTSDQRYQYDTRKAKGLFELNIYIK